MIDIGVARPSAQGQAMISTETAASSACGSRGAGPTSAQATKATTAAADHAGTNTPETTSAIRWIGARLRCASPTIRTIWASSVSRPTRSARITSAPVPFRVAPTRRSPGPLAAGIGSPVSIDSSTALSPSSTRPSTGIFSPARTRSRSPTRTSSSGTSSSAAVGADPQRALGREIEQRPDGRARPVARAELQHLPEQHQRDDRRRGLEVDAALPPCRHEAAAATGRGTPAPIRL